MSGEMTEFRITSDLSALRGQVIDANFAEVRSWLDENLEPYRHMAVTPDSIPTAKSYRANIRKVRDRIDESRKEAKNAALAAYSIFEGKCKELTGLCDEAANAIDAQIKDFEQREAQEKLERLRSEYIAMIPEELEDFCPFDAIQNPKWANKGFTYENAVAEIRAAIEKTHNDIETIRTMGGDDTPYLLDVYKQTLDLSSVVRKASELKSMREREEQRKKAQEAQAEVKAPKVAPAHEPEAEQPEREPMYDITFRVNCTKSQLIALGEYMRRNGINYWRA